MSYIQSPTCPRAGFGKQEHGQWQSGIAVETQVLQGWIVRPYSDANRLRSRTSISKSFSRANVSYAIMARRPVFDVFTGAGVLAACRTIYQQDARGRRRVFLSLLGVLYFLAGGAPFYR